MNVFDDDTALVPAGPGTWRGRVTDGWNVGTGPNGGYIAAIITRAVVAGSPFPQPLSMTYHYLTPPTPGPVEVGVEPVRVGRSHATMRAEMVQDAPIAVALATLGRFRPEEPVSIQESPPHYPPPDQCVSGKGPAVPGMTFRDRFNYRVAEPDDIFFLRTRPGPARTGGWTRLSDRATDILAVPLLMDCWPPAMFSTFLGGTAPTLELTVHWRADPGPGWHLTLFRSRFLQGGYTEEDGELWSEDGRLVAQSRQLARFRPSAAPG